MPHEINLKNGKTIFEVPMSTIRILGQNFPVGGGGYLRLLPMTYTDRAIETIHKEEQQSVIVYFHPWEIDSEQPRIPARWKSRLRHYTGLKAMEGKLEQLLRRRRFSPMIELIPVESLEPERKFSAVGIS